jgi:2-methylcitrate dehydratase PrpD
LRNEHALIPADIESVAIVAHPLVLELTGQKTPQTGLEGKFSVYHAAAAALIDGGGGEAQFSDASVQDHAVLGLRQRVAITTDATLHEDQARVAIRLRNGRTIEKFIEHAVGSRDRPMSDAELEAKFSGLAKGILSEADTRTLMRLCWQIATLHDVADIARAAVPANHRTTAVC